ncbi:MAG: hypothetical protein HOV80_19045 [Polyangiaceae bacterium]|nr:hypothetical protein [Polyangiaceae bacterium]
MLRETACWAAILVSGTLFGCGDDAETETTGGAGGATSGPGGGGEGGSAPAGTYTFSFVVQEVRSNIALPSGPAVGVHVWLDLEDGTHLESTTDATGKVELTISEAAKAQKGDIVVFDDDGAFTAYVDQVIESLAIDVWLFRAPTKGISLSGDLLGLSNPGHYHTITAIPALDFHQAVGASWEIEIPSGIPVTLLGLEFGLGTDPVSPRGVSQSFFAWTSVTVPALERDTSIDLDFAAEKTPTSFEGSFPLPSGDGPLASEGTGYLTVNCGPTAALAATFCGAATRLDIDADGERFDYIAEYLPEGPEYSTVYMLLDGSRYSQVAVEGPPTSLDHTVAPVELPEIIEPAQSELAWGHAVRWQASAEAAEMAGALMIAGSNGQLGRIFVPPGATEVRWPALPSSVEAADYANGAVSVLLFDVSDWTAIVGAPRVAERTVQFGSLHLEPSPPPPPGGAVPPLDLRKCGEHEPPCPKGMTCSGVIHGICLGPPR